MSTIELTDAHKIVLDKLAAGPRSFLSQWPSTTHRYYHMWYFATEQRLAKKYSTSETLDSTICEDLRDLGEIVPILNDEEFQLQRALGITNCRVYKKRGYDKK